MFHKQYGSGSENYFCLHGWAGSHQEFVPLAAGLPSRARLISVDLPGYGASPAPGVWTIQAIVDELETTFRQVISGPAATIGFCSGAVFALLLAGRTPGLVRRLVLIDPFAFVPLYFRIFLWGEFGRRAYHSTFETALGRGITNWMLRRMQAADSDFTRAFTTLDHSITRRYLELLHQLDLRRDFGPLEMPIDIVCGERTFKAVREAGCRFRQVWPQARLIELKGIGHLPLVKGRRQLQRIVFGAGEE